MQATADEVKYNLNRNGNGQNNVMTESETDGMLFLSLLLFSLLLVWNEQQKYAEGKKLWKNLPPHSIQELSCTVKTWALIYQH